MRTLFAVVSALALLSVSSVGVAHAQIPTLPSGPRFEIAEARGLAEVPARADTAFGASVPGPTFDAATKAVVVKFQASSLSESGALSIAFTRVGGKAPVTLATQAVTANDLSSGAYAILQNGGAQLDPGHYQASVVAGGHILRTVAFDVRQPVALRPKPPAAAAATPAPDADATVQAVPSALGDFEYTYPGDYSALPLNTTYSEGVLLIRRSPASALVLAYRPAGKFDLAAEARGFVVNFSRAVRSGPAGATLDNRPLPKTELAGHPATGRVIVYSTPSGSVVTTLYALDFDGTNFFCGYSVFSVKGSQRESSGIVPDSDSSAADFYQLVRSLRRRGPSAPALDEPNRRAPVKPSEVARVRSV